MATVRLLSDAEAETDPAVKAVFDDIRATRNNDFVNKLRNTIQHLSDALFLVQAWNHHRDLKIVIHFRSLLFE